MRNEDYATHENTYDAPYFYNERNQYECSKCGQLYVDWSDGNGLCGDCDPACEEA